MLFTDLYELSMARVYDAEGMTGDAVFELFYRKLPRGRDYILTCGQSDCIRALEDFHISDEELSWLEGLGRFPGSFLESLRSLRFTGEVHAMAEGSVAFPFEPVLRVRAPLMQAQLVETLVLNTIHSQSVLASKAARIVDAAQGRPVMDFGARKAQGRDGAMNLARTAWIAGAAGTSNVEAGYRLGVPVLGTMAHSFVQAWENEHEAFRVFSHYWPGTTVLVDTWDTLTGVARVIELLNEQAEGEPKPAAAVRLDSGDLLALSKAARARLDQAGYPEVKIVASSGLDEHRIQDLLAAGAPIDAFGVGTEWAAVADAPSIDFAYKLAEYDNQPRMKASTSKATWPGSKQLWRRWDGDTMVGDVVTAADESGPVGSTPLLQPVISNGESLPDALPPLDEIRRHAAQQLAALPEPIRALEAAPEPYPVTVSERLEAAKKTMLRRLGVGEGHSGVP